MGRPGVDGRSCGEVVSVEKVPHIGLGIDEVMHRSRIRRLDLLFLNLARTASEFGSGRCSSNANVVDASNRLDIKILDVYEEEEKSRTDLGLSLSGAVESRVNAMWHICYRTDTFPSVTPSLGAVA